MKKIAFFVFGALFLFSTAADAQAARKGRYSPEAQAKRMMMITDSDGDGKISKEEFLRRPRTPDVLRKERVRSRKERRKVTQESWFDEMNEQRKQREEAEKKRKAEELGMTEENAADTAVGENEEANPEEEKAYITSDELLKDYFGK